MESAAISSAKHILFIVGVILLTGSLSGILAQKMKLPDVVVFLLVGMGLGPEMIGIFDVTKSRFVFQTLGRAEQSVWNGFNLIANGISGHLSLTVK